MCMQYTIPGFGLPALVPSEPPPRNCDDCGEETPAKYLNDTPDNTELCESCYHEAYTDCDGCGDVIAIDDSHTSEDNRGPYCELCYDDRYQRCECCNDEVRTDRAIRDMCEDCYYESYTTCDDCDCEIHRDDCYVNDDGCYCEGCFPRHDCEGDIDCKPFRFLPTDTFAKTGSLRTFGVELETNSCDGYHDLDGQTVFSSKDDGSINGKEFVSTILRGDRGLDEVAAFCRKTDGWNVDKKCGYHLHIGCQDLTAEELHAVCMAYFYCEEFWQSFVNSERRNNTYCKPISWNVDELNDFEDVADFEAWADVKNRYQWFNVSAFAEHSTLEVRLHTGTLNKDKVCNWIVAHIKFVDYVKSLTPAQVYEKFAGQSVQSVFSTVSEIWNDAELSEFYAVRARKFGTNVTCEVA